MNRLKDTFTRPLIISALGSLIASIIVFLCAKFVGPIFQSPWAKAVLSFLFIFLVFCFTFWIRAIFNYINRALIYIYSTGLNILGQPLNSSNRETEFYEQCMRTIDILLGNCIGAVGLKPQIVKRQNVNICSLVLFPDGNNLIVRNIFNPNGKFKIKVGDKFRNDKYLASWAFSEEETRNINWRKRGLSCSAVISNSLPHDLSTTDSILPFRSAVSIPLKLYGNLIAALVIGCDQEGYLSSEDIIPVAIISQYLTFIYTHLKDYCPWHRNGWRDNKRQYQIGIHEFVFSAKDYHWTPPLQLKLQNTPSVVKQDDRQKEEFIENVRQKCESLVRLGKINNVFVSGTFNGWNTNKSIMTKDPDEDIWRCIVHLPKGRYSYQFRVTHENGEQWIFDPKLPLWLDNEYKLNSEVKIL